VDADPSLFEHILRYLRTGAFPLSYDVEKGHDDVFYYVLLNQARFYQIEKLESWLKGREYLKAVRRKTRHTSITLCGPAQMEHLHDLIPHGDGNLSVLRHEKSQQNCFSCPNGQWRHDGHRTECLSAGCMTMKQAKFSHTKLMEVVKVDCAVTKVEFDDQRMMRNPQNEAQPPPYHETS
jgi:hypothetical protein